MSISKKIIGLTLSMLLCSGVVVAADFNKGLKAAQSGDFKTALAEWAPLAEQGHADAQYNLAFMYNMGDGVPKNDKIAVKWYTRAAEQGLAKAQYSLGVIYSRGDGVLKNDKAAVNWYTKAAEQGLVNAQYNLGLMYSMTGVPQNDKTAVKWLTKGAEQGHASAQSTLATNYEYGVGILMDNRRAYMWYNLAGYNGDEKSSKKRDKLAKKMTRADISKAQDMSSVCLESNYTDC